MNGACDQCAKLVKTEDEFIRCMGFCDQVAHAKCAKLNSPFLKILSDRKNLFWMCDECVNLMKMTRFKNVVSSVGCAVSSISDDHAKAINDLTQAVLVNGKQMEQLSKKVNETVSTPLTSRIPPGEPPKKRRRDERPTVSKPLLGGTKSSTSKAVITVSPPKEMFWLYLSRIHPSVKVEAVVDLVKDCLRSDDQPKVIPLVKKDADITAMNFISYKVGMDKKYRESALDTGTWPRGILFREFEGVGPKNLWAPPEARPPSLAPRLMLTPATSLSPNSDPGSSQLESA